MRRTLQLSSAAGPACRPLAIGALLLAVGAGLAFGEEPRQELLDRIQRECLRAYPAEMLAEMTGGARAIPPEVDADPKAQMQFLDHEVAREKGLFYPSLLEDLLPAFQRYVGPGSRFLDLGSGDGRAVFLARALGAHATGIEYDPKLVALSERALAALEEVVDPAGVLLLEGDFFSYVWSGYDVIYYFDQSSFAQERVRAKLREELEPGALLLVGHEQTAFPGLVFEAEFRSLDGLQPTIRAYRRPAADSSAGSAADPGD